MGKGLEAFETIERVMMKLFGGVEKCENDLKAIKDELKTMEVLKDFIYLKQDDDELFPYHLEVEPQYVSNRSGKVITKEKYNILRKVLKVKI